MESRIPILGLSAFSGTGKTTLLIQLIPLLRQHGLRLGLMKHSHHSFEIDIPGKDSHRLRQAGACQTLVASSRRTVLTTVHDTEFSWSVLLNCFDSSKLDLILVEGWKSQSIPKIELHRPSLGYPLLSLADPTIIAVATDAELQQDLIIPVLDLNDPPAIQRFILKWLSMAKR